jgi:Holliday junction resolvase RusA-like endonuclease
MARMTRQELALLGYDENGKKLNQEPNEAQTMRKAPASDLTGALFIPYNVVSFKNSKQVVKNKEGKVRVIGSKAWYKYKKATENYYRILAAEFKKRIKGKPSPIFIEFTFARSTKAIWDYNNLTQGVTDLMTQNGWLPDDNTYEIRQLEGVHFIDKANPGIYIRPINGVNIF